MKLVFSWLILSLSLGAPAWADTDYHCLNACINNGGQYNACLPQCTYGQDTKTDPHLKQTLHKKTHKEFNALNPAYGKILLPAPSAANTGQPPQSKDYICLRECQQSGLQYQLCDKRCTPQPAAK